MALRRRKPETPDIGATPEALQRAHIEVIPPPRNTNLAPVTRKMGMHARLVKAKKITPAEYEWIERYIRDCEIVSGARPGKPEHEPRHETHREWSHADTLILAASRLRRAHDQMGTDRELIDSACMYAHRICDVAMVAGLYPRDDETMISFTGRINKAVERIVFRAIRRSAAIEPED